MAASFKLKILSPDKVFFDGDAESVIMRTTTGKAAVLANHAPYRAALTIGRLRVNAGNEYGGYKDAAISGGMIQVAKGGDTLILAQSAEWSGDIDVSRAKSAEAAAQERLANDNLSGYETEIAEFKLKRALNRIDVAAG